MSGTDSATSFRLEAVCRLLAQRDADRAARLAALHPDAPEPGSNADLAELFAREARSAQALVADAYGVSLPRPGADAASQFCLRRALSEWWDRLEPARRLPQALCRLMAADEDRRERILLLAGLRAFAAVTLRIPKERRVEFLAPLGTDLARAVTRRLVVEAAQSLARRSPPAVTEAFHQAIHLLLQAGCSRDALAVALGSTVARTAVDGLADQERALFAMHAPDTLAAAFATHQPLASQAPEVAVSAIDILADAAHEAQRDAELQMESWWDQSPAPRPASVPITDRQALPDAESSSW